MMVRVALFGDDKSTQRAKEEPLVLCVACFGDMRREMFGQRLPDSTARTFRMDFQLLHQLSRITRFNFRIMAETLPLSTLR